MAYNFGAEIKKVLKEKGMTVSEFARRINKSRENAYDIFRRKSLDTDLLSIISQVLDYDFLSKSKQRNLIAAEPRPVYGNSGEEIMLMREELFILRKEIVELRKRIAELEKPRKSRKK
jgi:transcriptional regulator with XRE-family HTH domain